MVHNGIIENYRELQGELEKRGAAVRDGNGHGGRRTAARRHLAEGLEPLVAVDRMLERIDGTFALAMLFAGQEDFLICTRRGSPLAIGYGQGEMFAGSDALALAPMTDEITYLEDGDRAIVTRRGAEIYAEGRRRVSRR